jgi:hypothetical protein
MPFQYRSLLGFLVLAATPALADSPVHPHSYKEVTPGGKYVFVMIAPGTIEDDVQHCNEETAARIREVRRTYTRSGMYRNDGSVEPLWTVDWYAHHVDLTTDDGVHLIRPLPWAPLGKDRAPDLACEAVSFFANGHLLRTYQVGELVDDVSRIEQSVSHYHWQQDGRVTGEFAYEITTMDGNHYVFDVRTGEMTSQSRPASLARWVWPIIVVIAAVLVTAWLIDRRRSRRQLDQDVTNVG